MKTCIIFGAAEGLPAQITKGDGDLIISADAGFRHLERLGVEPDLAVGDFDSLQFVPACREVIRHPVIKNDTDSILAVKVGWERGYRRFLLYGCAGGRPDHVAANYQTLAYIAARGGVGLLCADAFTASVFHCATATFDENAQGTLSLFSMGDRATVTAKGLFYPLDRGVLTCDFPLGQSNEFIGKTASVTVESGLVLAIWQGDPFVLLQYQPNFREK